MLGALTSEKPGGEWPHVVRGRIVAADVGADVAVISLPGLPVALPYVARLADGNGEPKKGTVVTSVEKDVYSTTPETMFRGIQAPSNGSSTSTTRATRRTRLTFSASA